MISKKMENMVANSSAIRAMFERETGLQEFTGRRMSLISALAIQTFRRRKPSRRRL